MLSDRPGGLIAVRVRKWLHSRPDSRPLPHPHGDLHRLVAAQRRSGGGLLSDGAARSSNGSGVAGNRSPGWATRPVGRADRREGANLVAFQALFTTTSAPSRRSPPAHRDPAGARRRSAAGPCSAERTFMINRRWRVEPCGPGGTATLGHRCRLLQDVPGHPAGSGMAKPQLTSARGSRLPEIWSLGFAAPGTAGFTAGSASRENGRRAPGGAPEGQAQVRVVGGCGGSRKPRAPRPGRAAQRRGARRRQRARSPALRSAASSVRGCVPVCPSDC
jgi:hypothetical protein